MKTVIDHLIYATPDLDTSVADLERLFGVRATIGGQHPGEGTRNALYSLGDKCYLEIMAPDPHQPAPDRPRWLGIDDLNEPRLVTWAARPDDFDAAIESAREKGVGLGETLAGGRTRPDGSRLSWRLSNPRVMLFGGVIPFMIDWGDSPHPSEAAVQRSFTCPHFAGWHPDRAAADDGVGMMGLPLTISNADSPSLEARFDSPNGLVILS